MLILLNKPFNVLCQFTDKSGRATLADYVDVPNVYPAGLLDFDSEGLVVLTDDGRLQARIADPRFKLAKRYWVQVEGEADEAALAQLRAGVWLKDKKAQTARKTLPIQICEGKNRQVRRMTAAVGLPTLRLVRMQVGDWSLGALQSGHWQFVKK